MVFMDCDDPELRRAQARRARDAERVKKLYDAKLRNLGADIAGIKSQVEEKRRKKEMEKQLEQDYVKEQEEIRKYLIKVEDQEIIERAKHTASLRQDWMDQQEERKQQELNELTMNMSINVDVEKSGLGAAQKFDGEDIHKKERERLQALQFKDWNAKEIASKQEKVLKEKEQDKQYAQFITTIGEYQDKFTNEVQTQVFNGNKAIQSYNKELEQDKQKRQANEKRIQNIIEQQEVEKSRSSNLLSENPQQGKSVVPGRVRPDHWKGMDKETVKNIIQSNDELRQQNEMNKIQQQQEMKEYAQEQQTINRIVQNNEYNEQLQRQQHLSNVQKTLNIQREQAKEREEKQKKLSTGKIERGFFDAFGKSYR